MTALRVLELPAKIDLAAMQAARPGRYPALFRTAGPMAGWDILFAFPQQIDRISMDQGLSALTRHPAMQLRAGAGTSAQAAYPFTGGWVAFFAYELGGLLEPHVGRSDAASDFPIAWLARIPAAILQQPGSGRCVLLSEAAFTHVEDEVLRDVHHAGTRGRSVPGLRSLQEDAPEAFLSGVSAIKSYICAGDVFQVNLSRGWAAQFDAPVDPSALFASLMVKNPAPFSALLQFDEYAIISSSPERLVEVGSDGRISTRPIAGTHPRGSTAQEDDSLRDRLSVSPKERAEHVMLVDLERNDLGRVCTAGSVRVESLMDLTRYEFVQHIESTIVGRLQDDIRVIDILRAVFPGGTITGCPKIRTMQIIRELETAPREAYTGSVGYINHDGSLDFNILIRSFQVRGSALTFRAGAGIVADSEPLREIEETRAKARGLLRTLGVQ